MLTEAQSGMVWTLRPDNTVDFVNSAWVSYTGRTLKEVDADGWRDLIHPDDREAMIATISTPLERGEPHEVQVRFRRHDGMYRRVLSRVVPVRDAGGTVVKWIGTTTDIHDLWLAREGLRESTVKLQESEKRFSNVASAPVMIWSSGPDKRCDWFNESWLAFTGRTLEQELGDGWLEGVHPQDRERYVDVYVRAFDARQPFTMEYRLRHRDGTYRRILDEGVPRSIEGRFYGYIGSAVDVTEQRLLEEQLLQSKKMEAVGQLAGGVAHDFNNLLTIINGYTDLMLARFTAEDTTRARSRRGTHRRTARGVADAASSWPSAAGRPCSQRCSISVSRSPNLQRRCVVSSVLTWRSRVESDGTRAQTRADRNQIAQVLLNLAVNAREAMPDGRATDTRHQRRRIRRHQREPPSQAHAAAATCGSRSATPAVGMTPEVRASIFEPFFTTKEFGKGSGLGLSVAHGIVEQSGGHIEVESEPGRGTTFLIYLPCVSDVS